MTRAEMAVEQMINQAAKGDRHARRDMFDIAQKLGIDLTGELKRATDVLAQDHQKILDAYVARRQSSQTSADRVLAPDDLTADDLDENE